MPDSLSDKLKALGVRLGSSAVPPTRPNENAHAQIPGHQISEPQTPGPAAEDFPSLSHPEDLPGDWHPEVSAGVRLSPEDIRRVYAVDKVIAGDFYPTIYGDVFTVTNFYPFDYTHGITGLLHRHPLNNIAQWAKAAHLNTASPDTFAFIDTETTGLSGGTGTYAFLVGIGRHTPQGFELRQYFLRGPAEETALLAAISEFISGCQAIVTFNGKAFDAPLLTSRYILQALTSPLVGLAHFDLLPLARRLWRDRLPSRRLGALEVDILGIARTEDEVPGYLVPEYYFDYIRTGDARILKGVFYHNAMDIVSLAALFSYLTGLLADPFGVPDLPGLDRVALARLFVDLDDLETAVALYEHGLRGADLPEENFWKTVERFSMLYKSNHQWDQAVALWQKAAAHGDLYAFTELAKYYEHEAADILQALQWTEAAIGLITARYPAYQRHIYLEEFEKRLARLQKKKKSL